MFVQKKCSKNIDEIDGRTSLPYWTRPLIVIKIKKSQMKTLVGPMVIFNLRTAVSIMGLSNNFAK